jgi:hypothetical protein
MNWKALHAALAGILLALVMGFLALPSLWCLVAPFKAPIEASEGIQDQGKTSGAASREYLGGAASGFSIEPSIGLAISILLTLAIGVSFLIPRWTEERAR